MQHCAILHPLRWTTGRLHSLDGKNTRQFLQRANDLLELIDVDDADLEGVDGAIVVAGAAVRLRDVESLVVERLRQLRQDARLVGTDDLDRRWTRRFVVEIPLDLDPPNFLPFCATWKSLATCCCA